MKLFEKIGKEISKAKAPVEEVEVNDDSASDDESSESPGAMLAEALGLKNADTDAIDAALKAAIEQFGK